MPRRTDPSPTNSTSRKIAVALLAVVCAVGIGWWLSRKPVELNENEYDLTLAFYRVCNQQSLKGLQKIEDQINESFPDDAPRSDAQSALIAMVEQAKQGHWREASVAARQALDDQVKH
ncbi:MAG: hypothetical protein ACF8CQ_18135 [Rhodopirellula sp. JB044]|uniref:hypothetical protein n=1 Tax=Rhodopirellula sp. JB044 TaxID=3342844 RepID=UPI00370C8B22